ncbi:hypothetical protein [Lysobacter enzymogenes]|uniref:hypothetical protein n=1 Tax=Lysobacter enzymogenes TaxID=69 RepID=UPI001AF77A7D|nr:hypothetical protein [Lysobacter enzymogenes]QQP99576.1 hypothetical protein JHW41_15785 [Lysobacter enzymogenes]
MPTACALDIAAKAAASSVAVTTARRPGRVSAAGLRLIGAATAALHARNAGSSEPAEIRTFDLSTSDIRASSPNGTIAAATPHSFDLNRSKSALSNRGAA